MFECKFSHLQPYFEAIFRGHFWGMALPSLQVLSLLGFVSRRQYIELVFCESQVSLKAMADIIFFQGSIRDRWKNHKSGGCITDRWGPSKKRSLDWCHGRYLPKFIHLLSFLLSSLFHVCLNSPGSFQHIQASPL